MILHHKRGCHHSADNMTSLSTTQHHLVHHTAPSCPYPLRTASKGDLSWPVTSTIENSSTCPTGYSLCFHCPQQSFLCMKRGVVRRCVGGKSVRIGGLGGKEGGIDLVGITDGHGTDIVN